MMSATVPTTASAAPAQTAAPADAAGSADFMVLLLLLMGVGTSLPQPEGQNAGEPAEHDGEPVIDLIGGEAVPAGASPALGTATPSAVSVVGMPLIPRETVAIEAAAETPAVALAVASALGAAAIAEPVRPEKRPEFGSRAAAVPPAGEARPTTDATEVAPAAAQTEPVTVPTTVPMAPDPQVTATHGLAEATSTHAALRGLESLANATSTSIERPDERPAVMATGALSLTAAALQAAALDQRGGQATGDDASPRDQDGDRHAGTPTTTPAGAVMAGASPTSELQASQTVEAPAAPATLVEPAAVAEQIVSAARVVVSGDEAEMHVRLDPPGLGSVHVTAGTHGAALDITISADRPETQALLTRALPEIQQTLAERGLGSASVQVATTPMASDGRRAPDRRPSEPRERPTSYPNDRRRTPSASRRVSAVDITV